MVFKKLQWFVHGDETSRADLSTYSDKVVDGSPKNALSAVPPFRGTNNRITATTNPRGARHHGDFVYMLPQRKITRDRRRTGNLRHEWR